MNRAAVLTLLLAAAASAQDELKPGDGEIFVRAHCGACHSLKLVTAQRGDREFWLTTIRWMQRTQNLWPLPAEQETAILDYLAANYDETDWGRRPPIRPALMPPAATGDASDATSPAESPADVTTK